MQMDPSVRWRESDGVLVLARWYPFMEVYPEPDALRLHFDLYYEVKHRRLTYIGPGGWHALRLRRKSQVDEQVGEWMRETIGIGNMK